MKSQVKNKIIKLTLGLIISTIISGALFLIGVRISQGGTGFAAGYNAPNLIFASIVWGICIIVLLNPIYYYFKPNDALYRLVLYSALIAVPVITAIAM